MAKQLFTAPAGAGKTKYVIELAREQADFLMQEIRVCVPNALQAQSWRSRIAESGGAIGIHVWTFDELVSASLSATGRAFHEVQDAVQNRLLRLLFEQLDLQYYDALRDKSGFIEVNKRLIGELKAGSIDPQPFAKAVQKMDAGRRLGELAKIYSAYQDELIARNWADRAGLHWLAAEAIRNDLTNPFRGWPLLIIDGFDDLPPSQLALLTLLAAQVQNFVITLTSPEQKLYPRYERLIQLVEDSLLIKAEPLPKKVQVSDRTSLQTVAQEIFSSTQGKVLVNDGTLQLIEVSDRAVEVRTALRWLKQRIVWDGYSPGDLAVLARDIEPYRAYIREIASEFGLPVRLLDGRPLLFNPLIAALLDLLRLFMPEGESQGAALPRRGVIEVWRSPYFSWGQDELVGSSADADALDILSRQQRVIGGLDHWRAAFEAGAVASKQVLLDEDKDDAEGDLLTEERVRELSEKFDLFLEISNPGSKKKTIRQFANWLMSLIGFESEGDAIHLSTAASLNIYARAMESPETKLYDVAALRHLAGLLDDLVWAEEAVGRSRKLPFHTFLSELSAAIASARFSPASGNKQAEIIIASSGQVGGVNFRGVVLMGMSEGSFPQPVREDSFLRDSDRQLLREAYQLPLQPSAQSEEQAFFYEALTRAREKLLLTRPVLAENGAEWVASPYWEAVRRLVDCPVEKVSGDTVPALPFTASWAEWWESAVAAVESSGWSKGREQHIEERIEHAAAIWHMRLANSHSFWNGDLSAVNAALKAQFNADHVWSASRLESFKSCGFLFFVQHVLQLRGKVEPAEGLDAGQLGLMYHDILEQVMSRSHGEFVDETAVLDFVLDVAAPILAAAPPKYGFRETAWWQQTKDEIIANVVDSVWSLADENFVFLTAEASFGFNGLPLVIQNGEDALRLHGFIDRVDRRQDGALRIIDYKTGGKSAYTKRAFNEGKKLQLPLYAKAAEEALGLGPVVEGFYWHLQQGEASAFQLSKNDGGVEGAIETAVFHAWEAVHAVRGGHFKPIPPELGCPSYCPAAGFCVQYTPQFF